MTALSLIPLVQMVRTVAAAVMRTVAAAEELRPPVLLDNFPRHPRPSCSTTSSSCRKPAFSPIPPVHTGGLEGQQRVDSDPTFFLALAKRFARLRIALRLARLTSAANELGVSHGGLSHHVATIEDLFGIPLLRRLARAVQPTDEGAGLAAQLTEGFRLIDAGIRLLQSAPLKISCSSDHYDSLVDSQARLFQGGPSKGRGPAECKFRYGGFRKGREQCRHTHRQRPDAQGCYPPILDPRANRPCRRAGISPPISHRFSERSESGATPHLGHAALAPGTNGGLRSERRTARCRRTRHTSTSTCKTRRRPAGPGSVCRLASW